MLDFFAWYEEYDNIPHLGLRWHNAQIMLVVRLEQRRESNHLTEWLYVFDYHVTNVEK